MSFVSIKIITKSFLQLPQLHFPNIELSQKLGNLRKTIVKFKFHRDDKILENSKKIFFCEFCYQNIKLSVYCPFI